MRELQYLALGVEVSLAQILMVFRRMQNRWFNTAGNGPDQYKILRTDAVAEVQTEGRNCVGAKSTDRVVTNYRSELNVI